MNYYNWGEPERAPHRAVSMSSLRESHVRIVNDKIRWTSHSSFVIVASVACVRTVNDKIRWTSHSSFVIVASVECVRTVNDKIRWTSHSSFVIVASVACVRTVNGNLTVRSMHAVRERDMQA